MKTIEKTFVLSMVLMAILGLAYAQEVPGTDTARLGNSEVTMGSIIPVVTENGKISLSVDGLGSNSASGIIQAEKPSGATVRKAYMAAASTGFSSRVLANGDVKIDGVGVSWDITTPSSIYSYNHWADVTSIVKSKIDSAPAGRVDFTITEVNTYGIDGEILVVIFDDPNQANDNTVVLLFGAQDVNGDTFAIALAEPIDKGDPNLKLDMALGISFGYQTGGGSQWSRVDVNSQRLTTSAGGQDDGVPITIGNGGLLTVGGLDDSNTNPANPYAMPTGPRSDDELYDLLPFVSNGDTAINVYTLNPSDDDNIFFASLFLASTTAVVGEGILLSPVSATNPVGTEHTVTAKLQDENGNPIVGRTVDFEIVSGPNDGMTASGTTDSNGEVTFRYTGDSVGTDTIEASFINSQQKPVKSNRVTKAWVSVPTATEFESIATPMAILLIIPAFAYLAVKRKE